MSVRQDAGPEPNGRQLYFFVRRPVLAAVISIVIVLLGTFALLGLPVARYPQITPPSVQVSATYPGATAEDVAQAVAAPIEQQLSGLDGLLYYRSSNSSNGVMNLQVFFDIGRDQDIAAVDVQNAIKVAEPQLPEEVRRQGIVIRKAQTDILLVASVTSADPRYDATYLANYAKLYVVDELKRLNGVGDATVFGGLDFAMTIRLDPDRMAQLGITVGDVRDAVQEQNATNPAGTLGREPAPKGTELTLPVTTLGRLKTAEQFADIIVRAREDGSFVRVRDIGKVELTSQNLDLIGRMNGQPTANILIYLRPGANQLQVKEAFIARMNELAKAFPSGVTWTIPFDTTPFVTASIEEVVITLLEAMALVTLVVFLFLQSWRATLIPILAVPVSIIGTFLGLAGAGLLGQPAHPLRAGAGDRHRGGRRHRGDRERRAHHGRGEGPGQGRRRQGDGPGGRRAGRDRAGALLGVHPGGLPRRHHRHDAAAVRGDAGDRGGALGHGGADADAGALRAAAEGHAARDAQPVLPPVQRLVRPDDRRLRQPGRRRAGPAADLARGLRGDPGARRSCSTGGCPARSSRPRTRASS